MKGKRKRSRERREVAKTESPDTFRTEFDVLKVDDELGVVFGWGVVCTEKGEDYFDTQGDHIEEDALVEAASDFMEHSRVSKEMHEGGERGSVVFAFPLTAEIAKSFKIETETTGLMIGMKPDPEMLEKFRSGELRGFSIGGLRLEDEEVN